MIKSFQKTVLCGIAALAVFLCGVSPSFAQPKDLLLKVLDGHSADVWAVAFSADGKYLASGGKDNRILVWKTASFETEKNLAKHSKPVTSLSFSPDGKYLASASRDNSVLVWQNGTFDLATSIKGHSQSVFSVAFSANSKYLASAGLDDSIKIWQTGAFNPVKTLSVPQDVFTVAFSNDNRFLAAAGADGVIRLWDAHEFYAVGTLEGHGDYVWSVAFSPDGKYLASASRDKTVKVWNLAERKLVQTITGHSKPVLFVAFSPDGKYLASAGEDKLVKLWDVAGGFKEAATLSGHASSVDSVAFSPNGKMIATASEDKTVRIWATPRAAGDMAAMLASIDNEAEYSKHMSAGKELMGGWLLNKFRAYTHFRSAVSIKDTQEAKELLAGTRGVVFGWLIKLGILLLLVVVGGGTAVYFLYRRKIAARLRGKFTEIFNAKMTAGKFADAEKIYRAYRSIDGDMSAVAPAMLFDLFTKAGKPAQLMSENLPADYFAAFAKLAFAQGDIPGAAGFVKRFGELGGKEIPQDVLSSSDLLTIQLESGVSPESEMQKMPLDTVLQTLSKMLESGHKPDFQKVFGDGKLLLAVTELSAETADSLIKLQEACEKPDAVVELLAAQKYPAVVYSEMARAYLRLQKTEPMVKILLSALQNYGKELPADLYRLLFDSYKAQDKLAELDLTLFPDEYRGEFLTVLMQQGKNQEALAALNKRPREQWAAGDYHMAMQLYIKLNLYDLAEEMVTKLFAEMPVADSPELYYDFARYCEQEGHLEKAWEIYKEFVVKGVTYKDVLTKYPEVRDKLGKQTTRIKHDTTVSAPAAAEPAAAPLAPAEAEQAPAAMQATAVTVAEQPAPVVAAPVNFAPMSRTSRLEEDTMRIAALKGGKMELIKEIGRGGMGIVYCVFDKSLNRKVAVKRMREEFYLSKKEVEKFLNEARTVAQLNHPNIVIVYEIIEQESMAYIMFEYIDGMSLEQMLENSSKGLPLNEALRIIEQICNGLSYAHNHNIIHRDLKPSNIMLAQDGLVKITDFGIARMAKDTILRLTGASTGTLAYMAPEQELGTFDARSDIYSLGVMIYEMLTGELPFRGPNFYLQKERMVHKPLTDVVPELPSVMDEIIEKCLQADPEKRYATVDELLRDLVGKV